MSDVKAVWGWAIQRLRRLVSGMVRPKGRSDVVAQVSGYAIYKLDPDGIVLTWNAGAERLIGYSEDEIIGQPMSLIYLEEDRARKLPEAALRRARVAAHNTEGWRVRKDGSRFWAESSLFPIVNLDGKFAGYTKILRDLTNHEDAAHRRAQAQKMEALGQMTGGVAHDFNNLLTVIQASVELAELTVAKIQDESQRLRLMRHMTAMRQASLRGSKLNQQLLAFARRTPLQPQVMYPSEVLNDAMELLSKTIRKDVEIQLLLPPSLPPIKIDPNQCTVALVNIAVNARDAMPNGGSLTIRCEEVTLLGDDSPAGTDRLAGPFIAIHVQDTGHGIPEANMPKVLEPFFTTKGVGKGVGLGLSQAYGFCRQSGGELLIHSIEGEGTTVSFYIPVSTEMPAPPAEDEEPPVVEEAETSKRVLIAEDDPAVAGVITSLLAEAGYMVTRVSTGQEALNQLAHYEFDLLFSDVQMPGGQSGIDLGLKAKTLYPQLKILLTSGYVDMVQDIVEQPFAVLGKPFARLELLEAIQATLCA